MKFFTPFLKCFEYDSKWQLNLIFIFIFFYIFMGVIITSGLSSPFSFIVTLGYSRVWLYTFLPWISQLDFRTGYFKCLLTKLFKLFIFSIIIFIILSRFAIKLSTQITLSFNTVLRLFRWSKALIIAGSCNAFNSFTLSSTFAFIVKSKSFSVVKKFLLVFVVDLYDYHYQDIVIYSFSIWIT